MHIDRWTLLLQTVNFIVLIWLLQRFLYRPVLRLSDARRAQVERQFAEARAMAEQASSQLAGLEAQRAGITAERQSLLQAADGEARKAAAALLAQARRDAQTTLSQARETLAAERAQAEHDAQALALDLGSQVALQVLQELPRALREEAWIERIAAYLSALPAEQLQALRTQLAPTAALEVLTAASLEPAAQQRWIERLRGVLGAQVPVTFAVSEQLQAGAELRFPQARLEFSWPSLIATVRERLQASEGNPAHADAV